MHCNHIMSFFFLTSLASVGSEARDWSWFQSVGWWSAHVRLCCHGAAHENGPRVGLPLDMTEKVTKMIISKKFFPNVCIIDF